MSETSTPDNYGNRSDEAVWERFVDGEAEAIEELVRRHGDALYRYLFLSSGNQQTAAQFAARTSTLAAGYRRPIDGFACFRSWLFAVATQNCVPAVQHEEMGLLDLWHDVKRDPAKSDQADAYYAVRDLLRPVRQPLLLVAAFGFSVEEAARICRFTVDRASDAIKQGCQELARSASAGRGGE